MNKAKQKKILDKTTGDVHQIGCASKEAHTQLLNYCRRNKRLLITYAIIDSHIDNAAGTIGKYHVLRREEHRVHEHPAIVFNT